MKTIVFTGGGTGGHIYPGLAVAAELCSGPDFQAVWIGSSKGIDRHIVEEQGIPFYGIPSGKLRRYVSLKNVTDMFRIAGGFFASLSRLIKIKPAAVFSKGGFVSVPSCFAAKVLGIPVITHESDFSPGLATKLNSLAASRILVSYAETAAAFPPKQRGKISVTGNPVRSVFYRADAALGRKFLGLDAERPAADGVPVLLVLGGSLGARQINSLVAENLEWLCRRFTVVHQTGENNTDQAARDSAGGRYLPFPYFREEMPHVLAAADIVLSRSGANSLWECVAVGKPMVLIPLCGSGTRGDQVENAAYFEKNGAAVVLAGENADSENLLRVLGNLAGDKKERELMASRCAVLKPETAPARRIASILRGSE